MHIKRLILRVTAMIIAPLVLVLIGWYVDNMMDQGRFFTFVGLFAAFFITSILIFKEAFSISVRVSEGEKGE